MGWARWVVGAVAFVGAAWLGVFLLARRLPPGVAREAVLFIPHAVVTVKRLMRDPSVPRRVKLVLAFAGLWAFSPIDLIPEFIPVVGVLDDLVVVAFALRYAARHTPPESLRAAWPGDPRLLNRLLGHP
ncbi:MAG: DUF1232 domain-containing protein [Actinobacteria bacterium]|nr:DUF1232 domain-containing protein [Actinomycetota bacterium]